MTRPFTRQELDDKIKKGTPYEANILGAMDLLEGMLDRSIFSETERRRLRKWIHEHRYFVMKQKRLRVTEEAKEENPDNEEPPLNEVWSRVDGGAFSIGIKEVIRHCTVPATPIYANGRGWEMLNGRLCVLAQWKPVKPIPQTYLLPKRHPLKTDEQGLPWWSQTVPIYEEKKGERLSQRRNAQNERLFLRQEAEKWQSDWEAKKKSLPTPEELAQRGAENLRLKNEQRAFRKAQREAQRKEAERKYKQEKEHRDKDKDEQKKKSGVFTRTLRLEKAG